jgi:arylsulfatase A-like enzyme
MQAYVQATKDTLKPREAVSAYLAAINFADYTLGIILDRLEKSKYADSTIVVLMGDHGFHMGEKNHYLKSSLWAEATRVPLIIYDPQYKSLGGREVWDVVSLVDIYPTLLDLAKLAPNPSNEGRSLAHFIRNTSSDYLGWAICSMRGHTTLITNTYKYTKYSQGTIELYNEAQDPNEWNNLAFNVTPGSAIQDTINLLASDLDRILKHQKPINMDKFSKVPTVGNRFRRDFSGKSGMGFPFVSKAYDLKGIELKGAIHRGPGLYIKSEKSK